MNSDLTAEIGADGLVRLLGRCIVTGEEYSVIVPLDGWRTSRVGDTLERLSPSCSVRSVSF